MTDSITFRTNDPTRWGNGSGMDLTATQIDINFWVLYTAIIAIQDHQENSAGIDSIIINTNDTFSVKLTNHVVLGPFNLPVATFNFRNAWQANQVYSVNDVFTQDGAVYLVIYPVANSGATFFSGANDGNGHNYYALMLAAPPSELPDDGLPGQVLQWNDSPGDVSWVTLTRNIGVYLETTPDPLEEVVRYVVPEYMSFLVGLAGSQANAGTHATTDQVYEVYQNGTNVGSVTFPASSPDDATFTCPVEINFAPGDILTIVAPSVPDPHMTLIAITLVATLP